MVLHIVNILGFQEDRQERLCNLVSSGPMLFRTKSKAPPTVTPESHSSTFYSSSFANAYGNDFDDNVDVNVDVNNSNDDDTDGNDVRDFKNYKVNANRKKPTKSKIEFS